MAIKRLISLLILLASVSIFTFVNAQDTVHKEYSTKDQHHETHSHHHHIAIFSGATTNLKYEATSYSVGLDYEYYINHIGLGFFGELIFAESSIESLIGISVSYQIGNIKFVTGPFVEFAKDHDTYSIHHKEELHHKFGVRVGMAYNFHLKGITITPGIYTDYIEGGTLALIYGIGLGFGF